MKAKIPNRRAPWPAILGLASIALLAWAIAGSPNAGAPAPLAEHAASPAPRGDAAFRKAVAGFIDSEMRIFPERATAEGDHRFDARVDDLSAAGVAAVVRHAQKWKKTFQNFDSKSLRPDNEADREWLVARCDGELLWRLEVRSYERAPGMYLPTSAIFGLIQRDFAPAADRMKSVTAREQAALANLGAARANLVAGRTPAVAIDITLQQMPATISFFKTDLPKAFASVPDGPAKAAFDKANAAEITAIESYRDWLRAVLRPKANGDYAIGANAYRRMLADQDMVTIPLAQLEAVGDTELVSLQRQFARTAAEVDSKHSPAEVAAALGREHPPADEIIAAVGDGLAALRAFVIEHHIATIPSPVAPTVAQTPPFMRATTFASMDTPGPFEKSTQAYFFVTLPDPSWPPERKDQLLAFFSGPAISDTSVHEVYPGHYVQFLNNRLNPDLVRALYVSGANAEGWALYCEQMMLDEGLHRGQPRYRLAELQMALLRACRYLVALRMHTQGMTVAQAQTFFQKNAYLTPHNARVEALRGTEDPGYLRYQLGKLMIMKLRADLKEKEGANFSLGRFHDAFLRQGAIPIPLIRRAMLGPGGSLL